MKIKFVKYALLTVIALGSFTSCVSENDYDIPTYKKVIFSEGFENEPYGNEVPVAIQGWVNANLGTGTRLWAVKQYSSNKFAEFSSYYSANSDIDQTWLITPEIELTGVPAAMAFATQARFHNNNNLSVWISQDYDGTPEGIQTATWQSVEAYIAGAADSNNNKFMSSGVIDLAQYANSKIRIGFKYDGNKQANQTTTYQLDNITVFEK